MEIIAVIDIGSNSIRLIIAEIYENSTFNIIYTTKNSVRLAKDISRDGNLNSERMNLAIETIKLFTDICHGFKVNRIISVATAAVRSAANKLDFLEKARVEAGLEIRILSDLEEAYYDYFGIINSMDIQDCLIMDMGGASTELVLVNDRRIKEAISLPFGAITLSERFNIPSNFDDRLEVILSNYLLEYIHSLPWLSSAKGLPLIGVGGTIRSIGKIDKAKKSYPLDILHNYCLDANDVKEICIETRALNPEELGKLKGLSKERFDIFQIAAASVSKFMEHCQCPKLIVSASGVRDGLIYEYILKSDIPLDNVLDFSIDTLTYLHRLNSIHAGQIWNISRNLFIQLEPFIGSDHGIINVLKTSSLLYDIGISIDHHSNQHAFYLLLNSNINGLTHKEKIMAAYVISLLEQDCLEIEYSIYKKLLKTEDMIVIQKLAIILKISIALNIRRINNVKSVALEVLKDTVILKVVSYKNPEMEVASARASASGFEKIFNRKLKILY